MKIYMYRHGMTPGNAKHQYIGVTDQDLAPEGIELIKKELAELPGYPAAPCPRVVYVSPMKRCRQTAALLFPEARQVVIEDFREINFGIFEEKSFMDLDGDSFFQRWVESDMEEPVPGGDIKRIYVERVVSAFRTLVSSLEGMTDEIFIVAHGGTVMSVMEQLAMPPEAYFAWMCPNGHGWTADWNGEYLINPEKI